MSAEDAPATQVDDSKLNQTIHVYEYSFVVARRIRHRQEEWSGE